MIEEVCLDSDSPPSKISKIDAHERQEIISHTHELTDKIEVLDYHTVEVKNKSDISKVLNLVKDFEIDQYINRIDGTTKRILIAPSSVDIADLKEEIYSIAGGNVEFFVQPIPNTRPVLRCQYERTKELWPVKFMTRKEYEDIYIRKILNKTEAETYSRLFERIDGKHHCIIYNDERQEIIAEVEDNYEILCGHSPMIASDQIAEYCQKSEEKYHAEGWFISIIKIFHRFLGCTAIMSIEPCVMCAMALNHLRIRRVFFLKPNRRRGAFTRRINLSDGWDSHHYYDVFQVIQY